MNRINVLITIGIIIGITFISFILIVRNGDVDLETAKCIGERSVLYVQLGCHFCETQEKVFGKNYQYLNVTDCFYETCDVKVIPTWEIGGVRYKGVKQLDELKELTGC